MIKKIIVVVLLMAIFKSGLAKYNFVPTDNDNHIIENSMLLKKRKGGGKGGFGAELHASYFSISGAQTFGGGLSFTYHPLAKLGLNLGGEYYIPWSDNLENTAKANSITVIPASIRVPYTNSLTLLRFNLNAQYYVLGTMRTRYNLYLLLGGTYAMTMLNTKLDTYDKVNYTATIKESDSNSAQIFVNTGVGGEMEVSDLLHPFANFQFNLPVGNPSGEAGATVSIPSSVMICVGLRFFFFESK